MSVVLAATAAALFSIGTYLVLQRALTRIIIGLAVLSHGANVLLMASGRRGLPPLVGQGDSSLFSDPASSGVRPHGHRHHLRGHRVPAGAGLPQLGPHPRRRGAGRPRGSPRRTRDRRRQGSRRRRDHPRRPVERPDVNALLVLPVLLPARGRGAVDPRGAIAHRPARHQHRGAVDGDRPVGDPADEGRPGRHRRGAGRRVAGAARHHPGRRPVLGPDALRGLGDVAHGVGVRHRAAGSRAQPRRLPVRLPGARRRGVRRLPDRRPVQPLRRLRDDADIELRAHDTRRP